MSIAPQSFAFVRDLVARESAIVLASGKEYLVEARLLPLARRAGAADVDAYVSTLRRRPDAATTQAVVEALTTNETSWFRDGDPFSVLRTTVIPELVAARPSRRLRVWCAAASSGQEPFSVAMTLRDSPLLTGWSTEILGSDLSEAMVSRCLAGRYSQLEVDRGLPPHQLARYFTRDGADWTISAELARMATFRRLNLVRPFPPLGRFDVVFLRNVLIYFDLATKRDILRRVRQVMPADGYLILGAAETTLGVDDGWDRIPAGRSSVYRCSARTTPAPVPPPAPAPAPARAPRSTR